MNGPVIRDEAGRCVGSHRKLSDAMIEQLCDDYRSGVGTTALARRYDIGRSTTLTYIRNAGIARRDAGSYRTRVPDPEDERLSRAEVLHLEREAAKMWARRNMRRIVSAYKAGVPVDVIAADLGVEPTRVRRAVRAAARDGMVTLRSDAVRARGAA